MNRLKITTVGFIWLLIKPSEVQAQPQAVYVLHDDGGKSLLENRDTVDASLNYGVAVGYLPDTLKAVHASNEPYPFRYLAVHTEDSELIGVVTLDTHCNSPQESANRRALANLTDLVASQYDTDVVLELEGFSLSDVKWGRVYPLLAIIDDGQGEHTLTITETTVYPL